MPERSKSRELLYAFYTQFLLQPVNVAMDSAGAAIHGLSRSLHSLSFSDF